MPSREERAAAARAELERRRVSGGQSDRAAAAKAELARRRQSPLRRVAQPVLDQAARFNSTVADALPLPEGARDFLLDRGVTSPEGGFNLPAANQAIGQGVVDVATQNPNSALGRGSEAVLDRVREFNTGGLGLLPLPQGGRDFLVDAGVTNAGEADGIVNEGLRFAGESSTLGLGGLAALGGRLATGGQQFANRIANQPGVKGALERTGQGIVQFAQRNPAAAALAEFSGGFGFGAGTRATEDALEDADLPQGVKDTASQTVGLLGGFAGGGLPLIPSATRNIRDSLTSALLPFTERGGRVRASRQMQERSESPERAAEAARNAPDGVTPARATGEERLLAQERLLLDEDLPLNARVRGRLENAQERVTNELRGVAEPRRTQRDFERNVMESVSAPPGAAGGDPQLSGPGQTGQRIQPGDTDEMLQQAFDTFAPAYAAARGHRIDPSSMGASMRDAIEDPNVLAGDDIRREVGGFLNSQLSNLQRTRIRPDGSLSSDDIIDLRQLVRARQRSLAKGTGDRAVQQRELFDNINRRLTDILDEQLPEGAATALRATDAKFRQFKVVEDAVFRAGEGGLKPEEMSRAIARAARSRGEFARGGDQELRRLALSGRPTDSVLGDVQGAERMVRGLSPEERLPIQADFADSLLARSMRDDSEGVALLSGAKLRSNLSKSRDTAKALGFDDAALTRMETIADELVTIQRASPDAVDRLFTDGPATVLELLAAIGGAKSGQRVAGSGIGAGLVIAQFMSNKARRALTLVTNDKAGQLMRDAVTDKDLFASLMTGPSSSVRQQQQNAAVLDAWLIANIADRTEQAATPPGGPGAPPPTPAPQPPQRQAAPSGGLLDVQSGTEPNRLRSLLD